MALVIQSDIMPTESDPREMVNVAPTNHAVLNQLIQMLRLVTDEFKYPQAPSEENNYFLEDPFAGTCDCCVVYSFSFSASLTMLLWS